MSLKIVGIVVAVLEEVIGADIEIITQIWETINKICTAMAMIDPSLRAQLVKIHR